MAAQADILTITLNPAVDVATSVPKVVAGPKLRCDQPRFDPGGGGVNVARTICRLGGVATALIAVGGAMGERLQGLLDAESVPTMPVPVSGETRQSFAVTDNSTGGQYRFSVPGQSMTAQDADALLQAIAAHAPPAGYLVLSGSVTPGLPFEFQSQIIAAVEAKVVVDTSSAALDRLIAQPTSRVHLLRLDHNEAEEAAGRLLANVADTVDFAAELIARGVAEVVVTGRGAEGSVLVSQDQRFICRPPVLQERSRIGAGDALMGAMTLALARDAGADEALQWGVAAAGATVETEGTALCEAGRVEALRKECQIEIV